VNDRARCRLPVARSMRPGAPCAKQKSGLDERCSCRTTACAILATIGDFVGLRSRTGGRTQADHSRISWQHR
jgi:hypothetical protein